jgi:hypothetical protein
VLRQLLLRGIVSSPVRARPGFVVVIGFATAILQSSLLGFAALFPPIYSQAVMSGQGVAGIVASVLRIVTKAAMPQYKGAAAVLYFALGCGVLVAALIAYSYILRTPFAKYYLEAAALKRRSSSVDAENVACAYSARLSCRAVPCRLLTVAVVVRCSA